MYIYLYDLVCVFQTMYVYILSLECGFTHYVFFFFSSFLLSLLPFLLFELSNTLLLSSIFPFAAHNQLPGSLINFRDPHPCAQLSRSSLFPAICRSSFLPPLPLLYHLLLLLDTFWLHFNPTSLQHRINTLIVSFPFG